MIATDAGYGDITAFRRGLSERGIDYVVQIKAGTSAYERSRPSDPRGRAAVARQRLATARRRRR